MSTQEILSHVRSLSLSDRMILLEAILQSIKVEIKDPAEQKKAEAHKEKIRRRRQAFKVEGFHLGGEVSVDRNEIYSERGL
ncbi:hypothetical protein L0337_13135 [candidate division KSB1 bacterium]|nr:hypothetical protein [candidate division KSB1 bacterium]